MTKKEENKIIEKDYFNDLNRIKETIKVNQAKAMVVVNSAMIMTYYEIGTIINERKTWGNKYIENLANDLKEYGKGYSYDNLNYMSRFAKNLTKSELVEQPARLIPWFTLVRIISKSSSHEEMLWYINETHKNGWSRAMALSQMALKAYERSLIEPSTTSVVKSDDLANELFKDTYVFSFLDKDNIKNEKRLKKANDLKKDGKGYSYNNLKYMSQVAKEFSFNEISQRLVGQIPWRTLIEIMAKHTLRDIIIWI